MFHKIKSAAPQPDFQLLLQFADGSARVYSVKPLLSSPAFSPLRNTPGLFRQVRVDPGGYGISWTDEIDLDAGELWFGGSPVSSPFDSLMSFGDAAALWGLNESTLRKAVSCRRLTEGLDVQKFGKQWIVTRAAMEREYGPLPQEP